MSGNLDSISESNMSLEDIKKRIVKEDVPLPEGYNGYVAFVLHNVYTPEECQDLINFAEKKGFELALVNIGGGRQQEMTDVRNSSRVIWDTVEEAGKLWERVKDYVPAVYQSRKVVGPNERLRILRYDPGEYFRPHMDGRYVSPSGEVSCITLQFYLNEGFEGGSTQFFFGSGRNFKVIPKTGSILVFQHNMLHEGEELIKGRKYTIRTDVMYSRDRIMDL